MMIRTIGTIFSVILLVGISLVSCLKSSEVRTKEEAEEMWGSERVCLPCHLYRNPIARAHNYRCDTCHRGNPWAEDKDEGHFELIKAPQNSATISQTCDRCHRRVLGRDIPYSAEFIKDVIVSHQGQEGETKEWKE
jgi:hypothetical protein